MQGDAGGKVSIFRGHYEKKVHMKMYFNPLNAELNPICHFPSLLGGATIVVVSSLRVNSVWLRRESCLNIAIHKHCEWQYR
jgi:hypothetical protein